MREALVSKATLAALTLVIIVGPTCAEEGHPIASMTPEEGLEVSVRSAVQRSPDDYIAGVIRVIGPPDCWSDEGDGQCRSRAVVVREIASKTPDGGDSARKPREFYLLGGKHDSTDMEFIAFVVPLEAKRDTYAATFLSVVVKDEEIEKLRKAVKAALGG